MFYLSWKSNINQIYKFLNTIRVAKADSDTLRWSLEDVLEFAKKREKIPEDEDELSVAKKINFLTIFNKSMVFSNNNK